MKFLYEDMFGNVPAGVIVVCFCFLWACGWYAKGNPVFGLVVAAIASAVIPILGLLVYIGLISTVGLAVDAMAGPALAEGIVMLMDVMLLTGLFIHYTITAREMRNMRGEHSIATASYRSRASFPTVRRMKMS